MSPGATLNKTKFFQDVEKNPFSACFKQMEALRHHNRHVEGGRLLLLTLCTTINNRSNDQVADPSHLDP